MVNNLEIPIIRTPLISQVLDGQKHMNSMKNKLGDITTRLPVTPNVLKLIKAELHQGDLSNEMKLLIWSVSTLAFAGSFRIHELLCKYVKTYDPIFTLLQEDVKIKTLKVNTTNIEILQVKVKSQKKDRVGVNILIDVYASGGPLCPVRAYKKYMLVSKFQEKSKPAFRIDNGSPLTGKSFNTYLKLLLAKHLNYKKGSITAHSFRAGLPTMMGTLGYCDEEIQAVGRWSSRAFESYLKLPRTKRLVMAKHLGSLENLL